MSTTPKNTRTGEPIEPGTSKIKSLVNRGVHFVKTHKKTTIAVVGLTGLVVANAVVDKKATITLEPLKMELINAPSVEVVDEVAN